MSPTGNSDPLYSSRKNQGSTFPLVASMINPRGIARQKAARSPNISNSGHLEIRSPRRLIMILSKK